MPAETTGKALVTSQPLRGRPERAHWLRRTATAGRRFSVARWVQRGENMPLPLQITFRDVSASPAVEAKIRERAAKLTKKSPRIAACHVVVEAPHRHQKKGFVYNVRIELAVPGSDIIVGREHRERPSHADVYVAIRDAFEAATRRLEDHPLLR
jgi:ribosome-associated translation inhibitor RaiA